MKHTFICLLTYGSITEIQPVLFEYKHTGEQYYSDKKGVRHIYSGMPEKIKGVNYSSGYWFIDRLAIKNGHGYWYINNPGDSYTIHKVSKYGNKIHKILSTPLIVRPL